MGRGRPRTPTATRILEGTHRADRHGSPDSWQPAGQPEMPDWLSNDGRALWCSLIDLLGKSGVATAIDTAELTGLCEWWGRYRAASRELDKIEDRRSTEYYRVQILAGQAWKLFDGIAAKFGLNPSDRAKLRFDSSQNLADPLLEFTQANQEASG